MVMSCDLVGSTAISAGWRDLVSACLDAATRAMFIAEDKGTHELKGIPAPMTLSCFAFRRICI
jgi:hypothetical protein